MSTPSTSFCIADQAPSTRWTLKSTRGLMWEGTLGECIATLPHGSVRMGEQSEGEPARSEYHFKFATDQVTGGIDYATLKLIAPEPVKP